MVDTFISKTTRLYKDSRALTQGSGSNQKPNQLDQLNENLQDVTRIMTKNMEDLLWRGDSLDRESLGLMFSLPFPSTSTFASYTHSLLFIVKVQGRADMIGMSHLSTSLRSESAKYRKAARNINLQALIRKYAPIVGIGLFITLFLYWRFF
jgi:vesicle transport protein SEC22